METDTGKPVAPPGDTRPRCACLMMQKDEADLLLPWVLYHGNLFGFGNLFVFDNGSTEPAALDALAQADRLGVNVDRSYNRKIDFVRKGQVLGALMGTMRDEGGWDVLIPLDCDEFLAVRDGDGVSFEPQRILAGLSAIRDDDRVPHVLTAYMNVLGTIDLFRAESCLKTFVQARGFVDLDHGFHSVRSSLSEVPMDSGFVYVHCHAKPFVRVVRDAREKLSFWCDVDSPAAVDELERRNGAGWHLVKYLRMTERHYLATFTHEGTTELPGFARRLAAIGADTAFLLGEPTATTTATSIAAHPGWTAQPGATPRRSGNGVMVFGPQGEALDQLMRALGAAGIGVADEAEMYLNRHWIAAFKSGEAEQIRRELLVLAATPRPWASWFPEPALLTPWTIECLRWPRAIVLGSGDDGDAAFHCTALTALGLPVLQIHWGVAIEEPTLLAKTILTHLATELPSGELAIMTSVLAKTDPSGWIDGATGTEILGWCWIWGTDVRPTVELVCDGITQASASADLFRQDLLSAGAGDGYHGFRLPFSEHLPDDTIIDVIVRGTACQLVRSGSTLKALQMNIAAACQVDGP